MLTLVLVAVFVGSLYGLYGQVSRMYEPANFEEPLQQELRDLLPKLEPQLLQLWEETAPIYGELALKKFEQALPEVRESSARELAVLQVSLLDHAQDRIHDSLRRIADRRRQQLAEHFPQLATAEGAEAMGLHWMENIEQDFEQIVLHFSERYSEDLGTLTANGDVLS